jgi:2-iminobutanoate/2-iminopropanoate deaminase
MSTRNPTYGQPVRAGGLIFMVGQIGLDHPAGRMLSNDMRGQSRRALDNVRALLEVAGSFLEQVLDATACIADSDQWVAVNEAYAEFLPRESLAKTTACATYYLSYWTKET